MVALVLHAFLAVMLTGGIVWPILATYYNVGFRRAVPRQVLLVALALVFGGIRYLDSCTTPNERPQREGVETPGATTSRNPQVLQDAAP